MSRALQSFWLVRAFEQHVKHLGKEDAPQHMVAWEKVWYIIKQSFNAKRIVNREEIKPAPMSLHQSGLLHRAHPPNHHMSLTIFPVAS